MEEFGLTYMGTRRADDYVTWYDAVISTGLTGDLLWCAFFSGLVGAGARPFDCRLRRRTHAFVYAGKRDLFNGTETPKDGYAIYPTDPVYTLLRQHAAVLEARG
jgi:mannan endo-1,4-beta-mannosidase